MRPESTLFPARLRLWLWVSLGTLFVTGLLWLLLHYCIRTEDEFGAANHPAEPWLLRIHGLAAFLALMVLGAVYARHLQPAWLARRNRISGVLLTGSLGLLVLSGYGLYYFAGESLRVWTANLHNLLGASLPFLIVGHIVRGRARRPKAGPPRRR